MGRFVRGSVVVVNYFFTDLSGSKRRPAVIVADLEGDDSKSVQSCVLARTVIQ